MVALGRQLDWMISEVFSNLSDSVILKAEGICAVRLCFLLLVTAVPAGQRFFPC